MCRVVPWRGSFEVKTFLLGLYGEEGFLCVDCNVTFVWTVEHEEILTIDNLVRSCETMKYGYIKKQVVLVLGTRTCMVLLCVYRVCQSASIPFPLNFCCTLEAPTIHHYTPTVPEPEWFFLYIKKMKLASRYLLL